MFGDNYMAFRQYASIDPKSRIVLPSQTGAEPGETLYLTCDAYKNHLVISKAVTLLAMIEKLKKACLETNDTEIFNKLSKEKDYYSSLMIQVLKVDNERRVLLCSFVKSNFENDEVFLSGQADSVHIFKNSNQYQELYGHTI